MSLAELELAVERAREAAEPHYTSRGGDKVFYRLADLLPAGISADEAIGMLGPHLDWRDDQPGFWYELPRPRGEGA